MEKSRLDQILEMIARSPDDRDLRYFAATEYFQRQEYGKALAELETYLQSGDDEGMGHKMRGICLHHLGRKEEALASLRAGKEAAERHRHRDLAADIEETVGELFGGPSGPAEGRE